MSLTPVSGRVLHVAGASKHLERSGAAILQGVHFHTPPLGKDPRIEDIAQVSAVGIGPVAELIQPAGVAGGDVGSLRRIGESGRLAGRAMRQVDVRSVLVNAIDPAPVTRGSQKSLRRNPQGINNVV